MFTTRKRYQEMATSYLEARAQAAGWKREYETAVRERDELQRCISEMSVMSPEQKVEAEGAFKRGQQVALRSVKHFLVGEFETFLANSPLFTHTATADVPDGDLPKARRVANSVRAV